MDEKVNGVATTTVWPARSRELREIIMQFEALVGRIGFCWPDPALGWTEREMARMGDHVHALEAMIAWYRDEHRRAQAGIDRILNGGASGTVTEVAADGGAAGAGEGRA